MFAAPALSITILLIHFFFSFFFLGRGVREAVCANQPPSCQWMTHICVHVCAYSWCILFYFLFCKWKPNSNKGQRPCLGQHWRNLGRRVSVICNRCTRPGASSPWRCNREMELHANHLGVSSRHCIVFSQRKTKKDGINLQSSFSFFPNRIILVLQVRIRWW